MKILEKHERASAGRAMTGHQRKNQAGRLHTRRRRHHRMRAGRHTTCVSLDRAVHRTRLVGVGTLRRYHLYRGDIPEICGDMLA